MFKAIWHRTFLGRFIVSTILLSCVLWIASRVAISGPLAPTSTLARQTASAIAPPSYMLGWGSAGSGAGQFNGPLDLETDPAGNVYVVDVGNRRIQKFTSSGAFILTWGSLGNLPGQFTSALDIAIDGTGTVYVGEQSGRISKFDSNGNFISDWQMPNGLAAYGIAVTPDGAYVYVTASVHTVKLTSAGVLVGDWIYNVSSSSNNVGVAIGPSGNVYVAAYGNDEILKYSPDGVLLLRILSADVPPGQFHNPNGIAVDAFEQIYFTGGNPGVCDMFDQNGVFLTSWGFGGAGPGQFMSVAGLAVDGSGNIFVSDPFLNRIQKFGFAPTEARRGTWGGLKSRFR